jgi:phage terminase large subunit-like protein
LISTGRSRDSWRNWPAPAKKKLRDELLKAVNERRLYDADARNYDWSQLARPEQLPPDGEWRTWLILAGRGFGKTRTGAEYARHKIESGQCRRFAIVAPTASDVRDVCVEGESGILACSPPSFRPVYEPSKRRLTWPNGAIATTYSADEPERLRGPQHDGAWCDEPASWRYPDAFDMLMFGLRLGADPRVVVTGTPKPVRLVRDLLTAETTRVTRGSSYDNRANLAPAFFEQIVAKYEGTRLGRQELNAELLEDNPNALWQRGLIEDLRVTDHPHLIRIVVAVDPSAGDGESGAEAGIIVAGLGVDGQGYLLHDRTVRGTPDAWAREAVTAYHTYRADRLLAETNNGGKMIEALVRTVDPAVAYKELHASRGKQARAEPVAALYEQRKVHHVGTFPDLEDQLCEWMPGDESPDRLDAAVWALTELMLGEEPAPSEQFNYRGSVTSADPRRPGLRHLSRRD